MVLAALSVRLTALETLSCENKDSRNRAARQARMLSYSQNTYSFSPRLLLTDWRELPLKTG